MWKDIWILLTLFVGGQLPSTAFHTRNHLSKIHRHNHHNLQQQQRQQYYYDCQLQMSYKESDNFDRIQSVKSGVISAIFGSITYLPVGILAGITSGFSPQWYVLLKYEVLQSIRFCVYLQMLNCLRDVRRFQN